MLPIQGDALRRPSCDSFGLEWRIGWERKGFRNSKGEPVANLALWKRLFAVADARRVSTRWVRGHNGDTHNERADALANKALALKANSAD